MGIQETYMFASADSSIVAIAPVTWFPERFQEGFATTSSQPGSEGLQIRVNLAQRFEVGFSGKTSSINEIGQSFQEGVGG
jgi:hypothetical protein